MGLPYQVQFLKNLIHSAEDDAAMRLLRKTVRIGADKLPPKTIVKIAKLIVQCEIEEHFRREN